ncbi:hypothetical protein Tco_1254866 [Tanacetum coccineum]
MFQNLLKIGMCLGGKLIQKLRQKGVYEESFSSVCCMDWGEVNPVHAYYNGSCTSKDNEDPSWNTSFKTKRTHKTSSALEDFICVVFVPDRNIGYPDTITDVVVTASPINRDGVSTFCENEIFVFDEKFPALDSIS